MYEAGALLLYYPDLGAGFNANRIVQVARVDKVTRKFYQFCVHYSRGMRFRRRIETVNAESVALPSSVPWKFPESFSSFCYSDAIAVGGTLWCLYEVGHVFGRNYEARVTPFTGYTYEVPKDLGFKACGFAVRELNSAQPEQWSWGNSEAETLQLLAQHIRRAKESSRSAWPEFPDRLVEAGGLRWDGDPIPSEKVRLNHGDRFCEGDLMIWGFRFNTFYGIDKKGRSLTSDWSPTGSLRPVSFPTAFPERILTSLAAIVPILSLGESTIWAALAKNVEGVASSSEEGPYDLPRQTVSGSALRARLYSPFCMYYSSDRIQWFRSLPAAVMCEVERLRVIHRKGGSPLQ